MKDYVENYKKQIESETVDKSDESDENTESDKNNENIENKPSDKTVEKPTENKSLTTTIPKDKKIDIKPIEKLDKEINRYKT